MGNGAKRLRVSTEFVPILAVPVLIRATLVTIKVGKIAT